MVRSDDNFDASLRVTQESLKGEAPIAAKEAALVRKKRAEDAFDGKRISAQHGHDDANIRLTGISSRGLTDIEESGSLLNAGD